MVLKKKYLIIPQSPHKDLFYAPKLVLDMSAAVLEANTYVAPIVAPKTAGQVLDLAAILNANVSMQKSIIILPVVYDKSPKL